MITLESPFSRLTLSSDLAFTWTDRLRGTTISSGPPVFDLQRQDGTRLQQHQALSWELKQDAWEQVETLAGRARKLLLTAGTAGVQVEAEVLQPDTLAMFLIRYRVRNHSGNALRCGWLDLVTDAGRGNIQFPGREPRLSCYVNGWQSWSMDRLYSSQDRQHVSGLRFFEGPSWYNPATPLPRKPGRFTSDFFTVLLDNARGAGILAGFLSQDQQFGHAEVDLTAPPRLRLRASGDGAVLPPGATLSTDPVVLLGIDPADPEPLKAYLECAARANGVGTLPAPLVGWCSWYQYFVNITPAEVQRATERCAQLRPDLPLSLVQVDDGFQRAVGDWLEQAPAFSAGLQPVADRIRANGFTPGLWLAPFIVHPRSNVYRKRSELLLRNSRGRLVNAAWNWNAFNSALDMTHPASQEYIRQVVETVVREWGFPYLKLDFLYAGCLPGRYHDPTQTRAQVFDGAMRLIRDAAGPETFLLGCGAPLGGILGHVEAMRVSADVALDWKPKYLGIERVLPAETSLPAVENALRNTVSRASIHKRWWLNDPDCLLLRSTTHLTEAEVRTQAVLAAMTGGSLILSDDLSQVPQERLRLLQLITPVIGQRPQVLDWCRSDPPSLLRLDLDGAAGKWSLISVTNWSDRPRRIQVSLEELRLEPTVPTLVNSLWEERCFIHQGPTLDTGVLPAHGTWMGSVRPFTPGLPGYAGSSLHISQGLELAAWTARPGQAKLELKSDCGTGGRIRLYLPGKNARARIDGRSAELEGEIPFFSLAVEPKRDRRVVLDLEK